MEGHIECGAWLNISGIEHISNGCVYIFPLKYRIEYLYGERIQCSSF